MDSPKPWWQTGDHGTRAAVLAVVFPLAAIAAWLDLAFVASDAERWLWIVIAPLITVFAGRSVATWLSDRPGRDR